MAGRPSWRRRRTTCRMVVLVVVAVAVAGRPAWRRRKTRRVVVVVGVGAVGTAARRHRRARTRRLHLPKRPSLAPPTPGEACRRPSRHSGGVGRPRRGAEAERVCAASSGHVCTCAKKKQDHSFFGRVSHSLFFVQSAPTPLPSSPFLAHITPNKHHGSPSRLHCRGAQRPGGPAWCVGCGFIFLVTPRARRLFILSRAKKTSPLHGAKRVRVRLFITLAVTEMCGCL